MAITTCIFDAYGTLFDVAAAARTAAAEPGHGALADVWPQLATDWRNKQLQYTWLRAITGDHCDFWKVTCDALDWALEAADLADPALRERLLALYRTLAAYPEVSGVLAQLKRQGLTTGILSNGAPDMLARAVEAALPDGLLDAVLSVESAGVFKPDSRVYDLVGARFGTPRDAVLFVSANGWDAAAAAGYGFTTVWINRAGDPIDRLPATPHHILPDLAGIPELV